MSSPSCSEAIDKFVSRRENVTVLIDIRRRFPIDPKTL
jgi:hypothetical protein